MPANEARSGGFALCAIEALKCQFSDWVAGRMLRNRQVCNCTQPGLGCRRETTSKYRSRHQLNLPFSVLWRKHMLIGVSGLCNPNRKELDADQWVKPASTTRMR